MECRRHRVPDRVDFRADQLADLSKEKLTVRSRAIRRWIGALRRWPVHPQWLIATGAERRDLQAALAPVRGRVLDIGCADKHLCAQLLENCTYIGLDYTGQRGDPT